MILSIRKLAGTRKSYFFRYPKRYRGHSGKDKYFRNWHTCFTKSGRFYMCNCMPVPMIWLPRGEEKTLGKARSRKAHKGWYGLKKTKFQHVFWRRRWSKLAT